MILLLGTVDEKSPVAAAGLRKGDIIMEINGVNVTGENHYRIMGRIKASGNSTVFLVADKELKVSDRSDTAFYKYDCLFLSQTSPGEPEIVAAASCSISIKFG